jgi:hypothetical protein
MPTFSILLLRGWIDIKGQGGYVLVPPSIHPAGTQYEFVFPLCLPDMIPLMDERLEACLRSQASRPKNKTRTKLATVYSWLKGYRRYDKDTRPVKIMDMAISLSDHEPLKQFTAGSPDDPKDGFGKCLTCNRNDVHVTMGIWIGGNGASHTGHLIELFPVTAVKKALLKRINAAVDVKRSSPPSPEALARAAELHGNPPAFIDFVQRCLEYRLAGEYANRLFMFYAAISGRIQTTLVRLYGANAAGKKMLYYWMEEFFGADQVLVLSSATAAWLKRKVQKGLDTRGKIIILIEERGDPESGVKYAFEQVYSEDKIKIGFNIRGEGGDWEPIEVALQGPLTFITTSTEVEESWHAQTREWEVNPDDSIDQSKLINDWFDWRELRSIRELEEEKKEIEVVRAYLSSLQMFNRYVIPFIKEIKFEYRTPGDRRKKPDLTTLIRAVTYLFQDLSPHDDEYGIIFAAPFAFDLVIAAAGDIIAVSRGALNRTEKRICTFLSTYYQEILSVTKDGKQPDETHSPAGFVVADLRKREGLVDLHDDTLRSNLKALTRKGWLTQSVTGRGRPGVWTRVQENASLNWESMKKSLIPELGPISPDVLKFRSSRIYEGLPGGPSEAVMIPSRVEGQEVSPVEGPPVKLIPDWDAVVPSLNRELLNYRIESESISFQPERLKTSQRSSEVEFSELAKPQPPQPPEPAPPDPFAKYIRQEKKEAST